MQFPIYADLRIATADNIYTGLPTKNRKVTQPLIMNPCKADISYLQPALDLAA